MIEKITDKLTNRQVELFNKYFHFKTPFTLLKKIYQTNDREEKNKLVSIINSGLKDLKEEAKEMTKLHKIIKDPDLIENIVRKILKVNKKKINKDKE